MGIYLYGGGGHAKVIADILKCQNRMLVAVVVDSLEQPRLNIPVILSNRLSTISRSESQWIVAIGDNAIRQRVAHKLASQGYRFTMAVHPSAQLSDSVTIGAGSVVMPNVVINADTTIGSHCIVNTGATIDHDCQISDYTHVAPGCSLCGGVTAEEGALLGVGTRVIPGLSIGQWTTCGAGSVVVKNLPSNVTAYGVPAKPRQPHLRVASA